MAMVGGARTVGRRPQAGAGRLAAAGAVLPRGGPAAGTAGRPAQRGRVVAQGLFGLGLPELVVIGGVAALLFGPSKLPELGKTLGKTAKSFQEAADEFKTELQTELESEGEPKKVEGEEPKTAEESAE